jgi:hypothetical protein
MCGYDLMVFLQYKSTWRVDVCVQMTLTVGVLSPFKFGQLPHEMLRIICELLARECREIPVSATSALLADPFCNEIPPEYQEKIKVVMESALPIAESLCNEIPHEYQEKIKVVVESALLIAESFCNELPRDYQKKTEKIKVVMENGIGFKGECHVLTCRRNLDLSCALMRHTAREDATIWGMGVSSSDSGVDGYRVLYLGQPRRFLL